MLQTGTNTAHMKISMKQRELQDSRISLSLEFYRRSELNEEGKRRHIRSFENLNTYLISDSKTPKDKKENKEKLEFAQNVLSIRKEEFDQGKFPCKYNYNQHQYILARLNFLENIIF